MTPGNEQRPSHLDESQIAAYIDGAMNDGERAGAERHLSECDECRAEVVASHDVVGAAPIAGSARSRRSIKWVGIAAAAALMVVAASTLTKDAADETIVRAPDGGPTAAPPSIPIVMPGDGSDLGASRELAWRSQGSGTTYRVTIGDDTGQPIHSVTVADTSIALEDSVALAPGRKYFWYVDAMTSDGTTATSGLKSFTVK